MLRKTLFALLTIACIGSIFYLVKQEASPREVSTPSATLEQRRSEHHQQPRQVVSTFMTATEEAPHHHLRDIITPPVQSSLSLFTEEVVITAIGDSLTKGVGDASNQGGYVGILEHQMNQGQTVGIFHNFGVTGHRTDQLLKRLAEPELITAIAASDTVLITIGANDVMLVAKENMTNLVFTKFTEAEQLFATRLKTILTTIKQINPDAHIYLLGFFNPFYKYFPEVEELNQIVDRWDATSEDVVAAFPKATFIPMKDLFTLTTTELFADDHFHPNEIGYQRMAERVLNYLLTQER